MEELMKEIRTYKLVIPEVDANEFLKVLKEYIECTKSETITADELVFLFNDYNIGEGFCKYRN